MAALMPLDIARHEVAHLLGAAVAYIGGDNPGLKHFAAHPRYHDANVYFGFDSARQQGEFAVIVGKESPHHGPLTDTQIDLIRRSSAVAPIGLAKDGNRVLKAVREAKHWLDLLNSLSGMLSPEDRVIAVKGTPLFKSPEELVGVFAHPAAMTVAPDRVEGIVKLMARHGGTGGTLLLREFVPRPLANAILTEALKQARSCFAIAHA